MENKNIIRFCLIIAAILLYLVASQLAEVIFDALSIAVNRDFILTFPEFIGIGIAVVAFIVVEKNAVAMEFLTDVASEMAKVVYPTPKESGQSAIVVVIMVGVATLLLAMFDLVWSSFTRLVLSAGGAH